MNIEADAPGVDFRLKNGKTTRFRVVDQKDQPLQGASISPDFFSEYSLGFHSGVSGKTDEEGYWTWIGEPEEKIGVTVKKDGYASVNNYVPPPAEEEHRIVLKAIPMLSGRVLDAATKQPIPRFSITQSENFNNSGKSIRWNSQSVVEGKKRRLLPGFSDRRIAFFPSRRCRRI